jgi:hypothetical protein
MAWPLADLAGPITHPFDPALGVPPGTTVVLGFQLATTDVRVPMKPKSPRLNWTSARGSVAVTGNTPLTSSAMADGFAAT